MAWQELSFAVDATTAPVLEAALEALGALAITTQSADEQALFEPPPGRSDVRIASPDLSASPAGNYRRPAPARR